MKDTRYKTDTQNLIVKTLNLAHIGSPGARPNTKHRTVLDGKLYVPEGTKRIK